MSRGSDHINEITTHICWAAAVLANQGAQVDIGE